MSDLSPRQRDVYDFIVAYMKSNHFPPSFREIGDRLGIRSTNGVSRHLEALRRKGIIEWGDGIRARSIWLKAHVACPTCGGLGTVPEEIVAKTGA